MNVAKKGQPMSRSLMAARRARARDAASGDERPWCLFIDGMLAGRFLTRSQAEAELDRLDNLAFKSGQPRGALVRLAEIELK